VGKSLPAEDSGAIKPALLSRFILFEYLQKCQSFKLEPWLKNIEPIDAQ